MLLILGSILSWALQATASQGRAKPKGRKFAIVAAFDRYEEGSLLPPAGWKIPSDPLSDLEKEVARIALRQGPFASSGQPWHDDGPAAVGAGRAKIDAFDDGRLGLDRVELAEDDEQEAGEGDASRGGRSISVSVSVSGSSAPGETGQSARSFEIFGRLPDPARFPPRDDGPARVPQVGEGRGPGRGAAR